MTTPRAIGIVGLAFGLYGLSACSEPAESPSKPEYPITPVPLTDVQLGDGFWAKRIETNRTVTIPFAFEQNETTGRLDNFLKAADTAEGFYQGERYNDTDVYKVLEGAAYSLQVHADPELDEYLDRVIAAIASAQEPDGYLFTPRTAPSEELPIGIGEERWSNLPVSHELYNAGHLYEAAVAHYQATGKRNLLDVAIRNANLIYDTFGPDKRRGAPGHQVIEMGLVKLYRVTSDERYLELARYFLEQRGRDLELKQYPEGHRFAIYNVPTQIQAHAPVLEQREAVGHAVRAMYQYAGMADMAAMTRDADYVEAMHELWEDVVGKKLYLTGGVGARHEGESFGDAYELPNEGAYAETCASIGLVFWSFRLFLLEGDARYLDVLERVLYNGLVSGVSFDGDGFFYPNPLASDGEEPFNKGAATRQPWFGTACCPGNMARFLPAFPGYLYAHREADVYIASFAPSETTLSVDGVPVTLEQSTDYPWDGDVRLSVEPVSPVVMTLRVRVPGWARGEPVPSDLYHYVGAETPAVLRLNGDEIPLQLEKGFAVVEREWASGDVVELEFPMDARLVRAHDAVESLEGRVALERGPLVYCVEGVDHGGHAADLTLAQSMDFRPEKLDELGGVIALRTPLEGEAAVSGLSELTAIPYFAWSHRGPGPMAVWLRAFP